MNLSNILKQFGFKSSLFRLSTDVVLVTGSLFAAFIARFFWEVINNSSNTIKPDALFEKFLNGFFYCLPFVLILNIVCYAAFGFYTKGKLYSGKHKIIWVFQAVSLSYLLVALFAFMHSDPLLPRSVLPVSWIITTFALSFARIWTSIWRIIVLPEERLSNRKSNDNIYNILVIGGAGYIGSALLKLLLERGYNVRLFDLFIYGYEPIESLRSNKQLEIQKGDFRRVEDVVKAMQGIDTVIHLGGLVGDPACALDEKLTIEINLMATRMIAEVAKAHKVKRLVFASTCSVYGENDDILNETSPLNPVSLYAKSKIASEEVLEKMSDDDFNPVILRFGTIYGFSGRTRFDLVVNLLTAKAIVDQKITLYGGDQWRPFVHVQDAARGILGIIEAPIKIVAKQTFNVGSDEQNMTLRQAGELIKKIVPDAELIDFGSSEDRRNYKVSFEKIQNSIGFKPSWTVEEGIRQVVDSFKEELITNYQDPKYSNVKFLTEDLLGKLNYTTGWEDVLIEKHE